MFSFHCVCCLLILILPDFSLGYTFWLLLSPSCWLPFIIDRCFWLSLSRCCSLPFINYHQQLLWQLCQAVRFSHRSWSGHRLFLNPDLYIVFFLLLDIYVKRISLCAVKLPRGSNVNLISINHFNQFVGEAIQEFVNWGWGRYDDSLY